MDQDDLFEMIADAYKRGAQWWQDNADPRYLEKAARDYADKTTSHFSK